MDNSSDGGGGSRKTGLMAESRNRRRIRTFLTGSLDFLYSLWEMYYQRLNLYFITLIMMSLLLFAVGQQNFNGTGYKGWYRFVLTVFAIDSVASVADYTVLAFLEYVVNVEIIRFYIDCFKGSLGLGTTVFLTAYTLSGMEVPQNISNWSQIMSTSIIIVFCYIARKFFQRRGYSRMTAARFGERLEVMETQHMILERLATWDPVKDIPVPEGTPIPAGTGEATGRQGRTGSIFGRGRLASTSSTGSVTGPRTAAAAAAAGAGGGAVTPSGKGKVKSPSPVQTREPSPTLSRQPSLQVSKPTAIAAAAGGGGGASGTRPRNASNVSVMSVVSNLSTTSAPSGGAAATAKLGVAGGGGGGVGQGQYRSVPSVDSSPAESYEQPSSLNISPFAATTASNTNSHNNLYPPPLPPSVPGSPMIQRREKEIVASTAVTETGRTISTEDSPMTQADIEMTERRHQANMAQASGIGAQQGAAAEQIALAMLSKTPFMANFRKALLLKREAKEEKEANIFREIVQSLNKDEEEDEQEQLEAKKAAQSANLFWNRIKAAMQGKVAINTYNGKIILRRNFEAKEFGNLLYKHLARLRWPGYANVTGALCKEMVRAHMKKFEDEANTIKTLERLLHCGEKEVLTKDMVVQAAVQLVKDHRNMTAAITDYLKLHHQIDTIANTLFWIVMFILSQIILKVDTLTVLAPLLTVIVFASFALGPTLGNLFMSMGFVLFMMPFDVGDRIAFSMNGTKTIGNVKNISLLTTTIITTYSEKIHIPNQTLFAERIVNLRHSYNATYEIPVSFALSGPKAVKMEQVREFWAAVRKYIEVDAKSDWTEFFVTAHTVDFTRNNLGYSAWVTSRWSFAQSATVATARMAFIEKMVEIQQSLGISFQDVPQSIELVHGGFGTDTMTNEFKKQQQPRSNINKSRSRGNSADSDEV